MQWIRNDNDCKYDYDCDYDYDCKYDYEYDYQYDCDCDYDYDYDCKYILYQLRDNTYCVMAGLSLNFSAGLSVCGGPYLEFFKLADFQ